MALHDKKSVSDKINDDVYASVDLSVSMPKYKFPSTEQDPRHAYAVVHDELLLDGNSRQNLATFCQTWEEPLIHQLMDDCIDKNIVDKDEYPQIAEIESRCVNMLSDLWNSPAGNNAVGCSTTGSSEAAMLGGMAMKRRWEARRKAEGKPIDKPNLITGLDIPIHVDGASGGFLAPFCAPDVAWDFRLPRVKSINASGHKFGLAPLGVGWVIWREEQDLPEELIFWVNYLGGNMRDIALNFSRPGGQVAVQYYNFLRLGTEGYRKIHGACYDTAQFLAEEIAKLGPFEIIYNGTRDKGIPALCWKMKEGIEPGFNLYDLADRLRTRGWQVPAYSLPANCEDLAIQRILVRHGVSRDLATLLLADIRASLEYLEKHPTQASLTHEEAAGFHH